MRTTLTIDDDLAGILRSRSRELGKPFKEVVNQLLRAGITANGQAPEARTPVMVRSKPLGLRTGFDPDKLNQLVDELAAEDYLQTATKDDPAGR
ncbi:MAG: DUF2191 domain-containing protein [Verrucomicrobiales bacterium]|nr:DUF2191 domain-containing protein [Verrucomicrobiales bacterium]